MRDQINALLRQRKEQLDALEALSNKAAGSDEDEARLFTADEQKEFDKIKAGIADIDQTLSRLEEAERQLAAGARPAPHPLDPTPSVEPKPFKAFKGQAFTRYVMALACSKGNLVQAVEIAKRWHNETPEVVEVLRAAVAAGTTTDPAWAAPLVNYQVMASEFIELLRAETILGRLTGYRSVPFNIKIPRQTAGATANWVGEGLSKPVSRLVFDQVTLPWAKIAVICVITHELARFSNPSAEQLVRDDLIATIAEFMDKQFIDPAVVEVAALKPASITNAAAVHAGCRQTVTGVTNALAAAMLAMTSPPNNIPLRRPVWLMPPGIAMTLAVLRTATDIFAFPTMQQSPPTLMGIPVVVSGNMVNEIVLLEQSEMMVADDGQTHDRHFPGSVAANGYGAGDAACAADLAVAAEHAGHQGGALHLLAHAPRRGGSAHWRRHAHPMGTLPDGQPPAPEPQALAA